MAELDDRKELYLTLCARAIDDMFEGAVAISQYDDSSYIVAHNVSPQQGDLIIRFDTHQCLWVEMDDFDVHITFLHDGKVFVCYPQEDQDDDGMYFRVEHPAEAAELLHLFLHPQSCLPAPGEGKAYLPHGLGELFDVRILFPVDNQWRMLDPEALDPGMDEEFLRLLHINLIRSWNGLTGGGALPPARFEDRWPDLVRALPDASAEVQQGYLMDFEGNIRSALTEAVECPPPRLHFFDLLLVPKHDNISRLYLRELLTGHLPYRTELKNAFRESTDLEDLMSRFTAIKILLPPPYHHQIRLAAEQQVMREWMLHVAKAVALTPGRFYDKVERHWHLGQVLVGMIEGTTPV